MNILLQLGGLSRHGLQLKKLYNLQKFKAGILDSNLNVVSCDLDDEDPFLAADESMALQGLIDDGCDHCEWRG